MRIFFGIIVGILLTIGAAYVSDALRDTSGAEGAAARPLVNWDVAGEDFKNFSSAVQDRWARLTGRGKEE
ncbi:MAG TPA: hypothetical protein VFG05_13370 [Methylocella sp.]|nr:hypothetical protein [Methylocella sp.]